MKLAFNDNAYSCFFGVEFYGHMAEQQPAIEAELLRQLPCLRSFDIHFLSPVDSKQLSYRWPKPARYHYVCHLGCRKAVHDITLTFTFKHIRHIPKINLSGFIKESTHGRWQQILGDPQSRDAYASQIEHRERTSILNNNDILLGICYCPSPCSKDKSHECLSMTAYDHHHADYRLKNKRTKLLQRYKFDFDDTQKPEYYESLRLYDNYNDHYKKYPREVKEGDAYAW